MVLPIFKLIQCARCIKFFAILTLMLGAFDLSLFIRVLKCGFIAAEGREEAEIDVHGLECFRVRAAANMGDEGAYGCGGRGYAWRAAQNFGCGEAPGDEADRGAFDIAFAACDLSGKADTGLRF